jgi:hypothetical protein
MFIFTSSIQLYAIELTFKKMLDKHTIVPWALRNHWMNFIGFIANEESP